MFHPLVNRNGRIAKSGLALTRSLVIKRLPRVRTSETRAPRIHPVKNDELSLRRVAEIASERHGGARGRALGRIAESHGLTLSFTTVDRILAGKYRSNPQAPLLEALAVLSGLPVEAVYAAAGVPLPQAPLAEQLPPDSDLLTPKQRDAVLSVIRQFIQVNKALHRAEDERGEAHADRAAATKTPEPGPAHQPGDGLIEATGEDISTDPVRDKRQRRADRG